MKTTIEMEGYELVISADEAQLSVMAMKDGEVVEEFTIELSEEGESEEGEELKSFGDMEEEPDFEEEGDDDDMEDEEDDDDDEEGQLESFQSFIKKRK